MSGLVPFQDDQTLSRLFELADARVTAAESAISAGSLLARVGERCARPEVAGRITASRQRRPAGVAECSSPAQSITQYRRSADSASQRLLPPWGKAPPMPQAKQTAARRRLSEQLSSWEEGDEGAG